MWSFPRIYQPMGSSYFRNTDPIHPMSQFKIQTAIQHIHYNIYGQIVSDRVVRTLNCENYNFLMESKVIFSSLVGLRYSDCFLYVSHKNFTRVIVIFLSHQQRRMMCLLWKWILSCKRDEDKIATLNIDCILD